MKVCLALSASTSNENVEKVKEFILENRPTSLKELARELNIYHEPARTTFIDNLGMRKMADSKELSFLLN